MAIYPPNTTNPKPGSGNYLWNWLGSSLKKFGAALTPYIAAPAPLYKVYTAKLYTNSTNNVAVDVIENTTGLTITWGQDNIENWYYFTTLPGVDAAKVWINNAVAPTVTSSRTWTPVLNGYPGDGDVEFLGYMSTLVEDLGGATGVKFEAVAPDYTPVDISLMISLDSPLCIEIRIYP